MEQSIALIVGLGNPEPEYQRTRHNAGFWFIDTVAAEHGAKLAPDKKLHGDVGEVVIAARRVRLLKPSTYMNRSGQAVGAAVRYYKIEPTRVLVVYDEIDFPAGKVRLKLGGGHAGHNGVRDVIEHIGPEFWRLRLGVGHPGARSAVTGHLLKRAPSADEEVIRGTIRLGIEVLPILLEHGGQRAQNALHSLNREADAEAPATSGGEPGTVADDGD